MQFFAFEKLAHSVHPVRSERANGWRISRTRSEAERVGWMRVLARFFNDSV
jgi:hypothetical protein